MYQSKANLDVNVLFGKVVHLLDLEIRKMLVKDLLGKEAIMFDFRPRFYCH